MSEVTGAEGRSSVFKTVDKIIERISFSFLVLSGSLTVIMVFLATYGVLRRYAFHSPEPYSYELSTMFFLFSFVFAVSYVDRADRHIRVDFFSNMLSKNLQNILLNIVSPVLGLTFAVLLVWRGWNVAWYSFQIKDVSLTVWAEPLWPIKMMIPVGYGILCLVLLIHIARGVIALLGGGERNE